MRNLFLASALSSLVLAQGAAFAQQAQDPGTSSQQTYPKEKTSTEQGMQPGTEKNVQNVNLFFDTDSAEIKGNARAELKTLADWARCDSRNAIILEGFADPRGSVAHNQELSGRRAAAVRQQLIDMGVPSQRIVVSVYGENGPKERTLAQERRVSARLVRAPVTAAELQTPRTPISG